MNSTRRVIIIRVAFLSSMAAGFAQARGALAVGDVGATVAASQTAAENSKAQTGATAQTPTKGSKAENKKAAEEAETFGPRIVHRITSINKLRQMMKEKIELTSEQKTKIDGLFDDYIEDTRNSANKRRKDSKTPPNKIFPPRLRDLEKELQKAQEAGDEKEVERIRWDITVLKKEPANQSDDFSPILIEKVTAELKSEQVAAFESVVARWKAVSPRGPRTGPFQQLRRALQDPEVGLSEPEKATVEKILADTLKTVREGDNRSPEKMDQAVEKARIVIFEKLTPQQRLKVEANLRTFRAEEKNLDDSKVRAMQKTDRAKKDSKAGPKKESTDKAEPDEGEEDEEEK